jgi:hypothetical protein
MWRKFCNALPHTSVTHLYVSEHTIDLALKNKMRDHIRDNRKKHNKHSSMRNLAVIERCTNMWWNPINAIRHQIESKWQAKEAEKEARRLAREPPPQYANKYKPEPVENLSKNIHHTAYWAEGFGKGGNVAWRFECSCLEVCSSYENWRFHPVGRQFQCTSCQKWAHVGCVLGSAITDDDLEELKEVLCHRCSATKRRERLAEMKSLGIDYRRLFTEPVEPAVHSNAAANASAGSSTSEEPAAQDIGGSAGGAFDHIPDNEDEAEEEEEGEAGAPTLNDPRGSDRVRVRARESESDEKREEGGERDVKRQRKEQP